jgi:transposase-like protein
LTIRQLGYPTKNALKSWHREFEQRHDLPTGYARRTKYSKAQQDRAVQRYLDNGRCFAATIAVLGYPSRRLLFDRVRELHPRAGTHVVGTSRKLPPALKQAAVVALCVRHTSAQSVAQELGVSRLTLYNRKHRLLGQDAPASMKRQQGPPTGSERVELEQQLETLRRSVRCLMMPVYRIALRRIASLSAGHKP